MFRSDWAAPLRCCGWSRKEPLDELAAARLRAEQFSTVARHTPCMMLANACNALALVAALWGTPQKEPALLWATGLLLFASVIYLRQRRRRSTAKPIAVQTRVMRRAIFNAVALGSFWAAAPLCFFQNANGGAQLLIACLSAGMLCGGAFVLASIPLAAAAFAGPIALASLATLIRIDMREHLLIAIVLGVYSLVLLRGVLAHGEQIRARVLMQLDTEQAARTDVLTLLPNRLWFEDAISKAFAAAARSGERFLLILVDLDDFKLVNDRLGHLAGDELLMQAAKRMRACMRPSDLVARLGGDEFAILASDAKTGADAITIAQRVVGCFVEPFVIDGREAACTASLGVAVAMNDGEDPRALLRSADIALYQAKRLGGTFRLFSPEGDAETKPAA